VSETPGFLHRAIDRWEQFWFENVPSDVFALVRIAVGAAGLISLIGFLPVAMYWSPDGIAPVPGGGYGLRSYVFESGFGVAVGWTMFLTLFASFICMTVGLFTEAAVVICFLGSALQTRWNSLPLTSGHSVLVAVLFCLVWADCAARLSVDAWRRPAGSGTVASQPIWPLRLIRIQVALVYLTSGFYKLLGPAWRDGSAIHYTTGHNIYGRILHLYPLPGSLDWMLTLLTYATVLWEISFAFMLLNRVTRRIALVAGVAVHGGIWALMEIGPFSWMMLATYVAFLDPHAAARFVSSRLPGSPKDGALPGRASPAASSPSAA
jgi:hypothetical protein